MKISSEIVGVFSIFISRYYCISAFTGRFEHHCFSCLFAASFRPKSWLQYPHSKGFRFKWTVLTCIFSLSFNLNLFSQKLQGNGLESLCILSTCILSLSERSHWYGQCGHYGNTGCQVFIGRDTKFEWFLAKNQQTERKLLNFVKASCQKLGIIFEIKVI